MTIVLRNYKPLDLQALVNLINAADVADQTEYGTSVEEMRLELSIPELDPERNAFVADSGSTLTGFALLHIVKEDEANGFRSQMVVHPANRGHGWEDELLRRLYARAEERLAECKVISVYFDSVADIRQQETISALQRFGMHEIRRFWTMVCPSLENLPQSALPAGLQVRPYRLHEDDQVVNEACNEAFRDHWGHTDHPLDVWLHYISQPSFRPELSILAENPVNKQIAGMCLIIVNQQENERLGAQRGWIDILAVRRQYRRLGLGTALILRGMRSLHEAGCNQAVLGCDSENLTGATRIYERVGFHVDKTRVSFRKLLRGGPSEPARSLAIAERLVAGD